MKAVVLVDIPDDVNVDINNLIVKDITFKDTSSDLGITYTIHRPKISIKPLPQINEKRVNYLRECGWGLMELECYAVGHDDCLDEILGEEE